MKIKKRISIPLEEFDIMVEAYRIMLALLATGVENWEGFDDAIKVAENWEDNNDLRVHSDVDTNESGRRGIH